MNKLILKNYESISAEDAEQYADSNKYIIIAESLFCTKELMCLAQMGLKYCWIISDLKIESIYDTFKEAIQDLLNEKYFIRLVNRNIKLNVAGVGDKYDLVTGEWHEIIGE